jgi:S1-C subfamily serine protease
MTAAARVLLGLVLSLAGTGGPEGYLGVRVEAPAFADDDTGGDPDLAPGFAVTLVVENSPAQAAGLQAGDRVLRINGITPRTTRHFDGIVAALEPGSEARIEARRGDRIIEVKAFAVPRLVPRTAPDVRHLVEGRRLGLALVTIDDVESHLAGVPPGDGVRVRRLLKGSPAEGSGLLPGDILVSIGGQAVHGGDDFIALARSLAPGKETSLVVARGAARETVTLKARDPDSYVSYFHFPGVVIYENDPKKDETMFGAVLYIFMYSRKENERTYRFLWFIRFTTGTNEELEEVKE